MFSQRTMCYLKFLKFYLVKGLFITLCFTCGGFIWFYGNGTDLSMACTTMPERPPFITRDDKYNWNYSGHFNIKHKQFQPALNATEYKWYLELIAVFQKQCEDANLAFLLDGGSVLGAYRFHGFEPWDDDFDVRMRYEDREAIAKVLGNVPGHTFLRGTNEIWKFFNNRNSISTRYPWKWPFIDILFFKVNTTHFFDAFYGETKRRPFVSHPNRDIFPIADILPKVYGVFEDLILPVPRNMKGYIERKYHDMPNWCRTSTWGHKLEMLVRDEKTCDASAF